MNVFKCGKPFNPSNFLTHMDKCGTSQRNILQSTKRTSKILSQRMSVFFDVVPSPKKMRVTNKSPSDSGNTTSNADGVGKQTVDLSAEDDEKEDHASRNLTTLGDDGTDDNNEGFNDDSNENNNNDDDDDNDCCGSGKDNGGEPTAQMLASTKVKQHLILIFR
mmetsp:Transcript_61471/g.123220  ORF Transcript_61471/g.123220 Transcript_61471/m.123220 type:complete len:163 (-) Transcript_61471:808-1296(-)